MNNQIYNDAKQEIDLILSSQTQNIKSELFYQPTMNIGKIELSDKNYLKNCASIELKRNQAIISAFDMNNKSLIKNIKQSCTDILSTYANVVENNNIITVTWFQISDNIKKYQIKQLNCLQEKYIQRIRNIRQFYMKQVEEITDKNLKFNTKQRLEDLIKESQNKLSSIYKSFILLI